MDPDTGSGFGYEEYSTRKMRIDKSANFLVVEVFPLLPSTSSLVPLEYVNYTAYLAEEEMQLYDAMNCHNGNYLSSGFSSSLQIDATQIRFDVNKG